MENEKEKKTRGQKGSLSWKPNFRDLKPGENYRSNLIKFLSWVDENVDKEKFQKHFVEWLEKYDGELAKSTGEFKLWQLSNLMNYAYLEKNGANFTSDTKLYIKKEIEKLKEILEKKISDKKKEDEEQKDTETTKQKNINKYMKYQALVKQYINLDKGDINQIISRMFAEKIPDYALDMILEDLQDWVNFYLSQKTRENKEKLQRLDVFISSLEDKKIRSKALNDLKSLYKKKREEYKKDRVRLAGTREKRTKQITSDEKQKSRKSVRYKKESDYGYRSLKPEAIVGAKIAITFDDTLRILNIYIAEDATGLFLSRSKIKGFDPEKSFSIKIRKPEEHLDKIVKLKPEKLELLILRLKTKKQQIKPLLTERTVILKAFY